MNERGFWELDQLNDAELERELGNLVTHGREVDARVVAHLAEVEARQLHLKRGAASLFAYCQKQLNLSENQAFYRITAARVGRQFPVIFGMLERGELHLSSIALLSKHVTVPNHVWLFAQARGKTKLQILELLARHAPRPDAANIIKKLLRPSLARAVPAGPTGALEPLSSTSYRLQLNISPAVKRKLEVARDLMSHSNPSGDLSIVVEQALDVLIVRLQSQRFGQLRPQKDATEQHVTTPAGTASTASTPSINEAERVGAPAYRPHRSQRKADDQAKPNGQAEANTNGQDGARHLTKQRVRRAIPRGVRRKLVERDGPCCSFVGENGERCDATAFLQVHHVHAWAKGGADSLDNLRLLCAAHNRLLAELEFGTTKRAS